MFFVILGDFIKFFLVVVVVDVGKVVVVIMVYFKKYYVKIYKLISNCYILDDVVVIFSEILGKKIKYEWMLYEDFRSCFINVVGFSGEDVDGILEIYKFIDEECLLVNDLDMFYFIKIIGEEFIILKEWVIEVVFVFSVKL